MKKIIAKTSFINSSPRKLRLVADAVRKLSPVAALDQLIALPHRGAKVLLAVYRQALGNAKNNFKLSSTNLVVESLQIMDGPRSKRRDYSHGARFNSGTRHKKLSHVSLILAERISKNGK